MLELPTEIMGVLRPFAPAFREGVWEWIKVLRVGAAVFQETSYNT